MKSKAQLKDFYSLTSLHDEAMSCFDMNHQRPGVSGHICKYVSDAIARRLCPTHGKATILSDLTTYLSGKL